MTKKTISTNCTFCHKDILITPYQKKSKHNYCSRKCVAEWRKINYRGENNPFYSKTPSNEVLERLKQYWFKPGKRISTKILTDVICVTCNNHFLIDKKRLNHNKSGRFFCNKICRENQGIMQNCITCNKEIIRRKSEVGKVGNFCSSKCYKIYQKENPTRYRDIMKELIAKGLWTSPPKTEAGLKSMAEKLHIWMSAHPSFKGKKHTLETIKKVSGENSPHWKGGLSYEEYTPAFNTYFKKGIKERDNNCCVVCNTSIVSLKYLQVHHIDYNKKNSIPQNCVALCVRCHTITNYNREHWKTFFQSLLREKYGYIYELGKPVIELK